MKIKPFYNGKRLTDNQREIISICVIREHQCRNCECSKACERFCERLGAYPETVYHNVTDYKGNRTDFWSFE